mgnify:CR=1 FL=1
MTSIVPVEVAGPMSFIVNLPERERATAISFSGPTSKAMPLQTGGDGRHRFWRLHGVPLSRQTRWRAGAVNTANPSSPNHVEPLRAPVAPNFGDFSPSAAPLPWVRLVCVGTCSPYIACRSNFTGCQNRSSRPVTFQTQVRKRVSVGCSCLTNGKGHCRKEEYSSLDH